MCIRAPAYGVILGKGRRHYQDEVAGSAWERMAHVRAELGSMRFMTTQHVVANLVDRLRLNVTDFPDLTTQ